MKRVAAIAVIVLAAGCRTAPTPQQNPFAGRRDAVLAGAKLFHQHCAECHGVDAEGRGSAPTLHSAGVADRSDASLFAFITNGDMRYGMPSWARLSEQRRWQIVSYLRTLEPH